MLGAVVLRSRSNYNHLKAAYRSQVEYLAWAVRNLLELRIWMQYVTTSTENAERFLNDYMIDSEGFVRGMMGLLKNSTERQQDMKTLKQQEQRIAKFRTTYDFRDETKYLNIGKIAKFVGWESVFYNLNMILSKLVHLTSLSVMLTLTKEDDLALRSMMMALGCEFGKGTLDVFAQRVRAFGMDTSGIE
ncbi:MAG: hypothetical protein AUI36_27750 [Cyanobacteria bacterium 13_1_40CM_2_61_4]|nr:MAG: hypothetical protein AUI36_27750 [Cyanobacteria bacterium 13_1_40CM_2_61_4]